MSAVGCEVAVVGLGAAGSSVLYQLALRGVDAVGIDRFAPPHARGSSHGQSRITRQAIGEGEAYVPLALRSNAIWEALGERCGERLLERCGFLYVTRDDAGTSHHGRHGFLGRTHAAAQRFGIEHELLDAAALGTRFPQFMGLVGDEQAYYEPGGGYLKPERCIAAQLDAARALGAPIHGGTAMAELTSRPGCVRVRTPAIDIEAKHVVLATGSWIPRHAPAPIARRITVHRQALHWFDLLDAAAWRAGAMPTFIWTHGSAPGDQFYGFPPIDGAVKVAREDYGGGFDPDAPPAAPEAGEGLVMARRHAVGRLAGIAARPARSAVCHYAVVDDQHFIVDRSPEDARVRIVSACSGHGFKHAAAIGEAIAQSIVGEPPTVDLSPFSAARFEAP